MNKKRKCLKCIKNLDKPVLDNKKLNTFLVQYRFYKQKTQQLPSKMSDNGAQPGYVYLLGNESTPFIWKVGFTKNITDRLYDLSRPTGVLSPFYVIRKVFVPDMKKFEDRFHAQFAPWRVSKKEGFGVLVKNGLDMNEIVQAIEKFTVFKQVALGAFDTLLDAFPDQPAEAAVDAVQVQSETPLTIATSVSLKKKRELSTTTAAVKARQRYATAEGKKKQAEYTARYKSKKVGKSRL